MERLYDAAHLPQPGSAVYPAPRPGHLPPEPGLPDALGPVDGRLRADDATDPYPLLRRTALLYSGYSDNRTEGIDLCTHPDSSWQAAIGLWARCICQRSGPRPCRCSSCALEGSVTGNCTPSQSSSALASRQRGQSWSPSTSTAGGGPAARRSGGPTGAGRPTWLMSVPT